jgi:hypothetical protein
VRIAHLILFLSLLLFIDSCITQFIPETSEDRDLLVVDGLITDQPGMNIIKLSASMPLGKPSLTKPLSGCNVTISDDLGNSYIFTESERGKYISDTSVFQGSIGRSYTLHIKVNSVYNNRTYESEPMKMNPVPSIDSLYWERETIAKADPWTVLQEGCQVYLNTHDPSGSCKFYRWEFAETWEFYNPYALKYNTGWVSASSDHVNVKSTLSYSEDRIKGYPLEFISNKTDRLSVKYSVLVYQYSLNENEFEYWDKLHNVSENVGGLYDIIPESFPTNISCTEDPEEKVLGYFSVSAKSSKRLFIKDHFSGLVNLYSKEACVGDTIFNGGAIPNLGSSVWVIVDHQMPPPAYKVITYNKGCADVTVRGTIVRPDFWDDGN